MKEIWVPLLIEGGGSPTPQLGSATRTAWLNAKTHEDFEIQSVNFTAKAKILKFVLNLPQYLFIQLLKTFHKQF